MKILITRRGESYCADFCDLPGDPALGRGDTEKDAIADLEAKNDKVKDVEGPHEIRRYG